jgi:7,8-dihydropterin-6-yl-methyl-4-(beta-D-ribofuranosyl)aminobenzene 5'-phosphate synthase
MKISIICENSVSVPVPKGLMGEHGLSILIEGEKNTLFDTGQGVGIINNMKALGKDINAIDRIIISHGHYDHTGGLMDLLEEIEGEVPIYLHGSAFIPKVAHVVLPQADIQLPIGFQHAREDYEKKGARFKEVSNFTRVDDEISIITDIDRPSDWKSWDARLKQKEGDELRDDPFDDDLSLLLETGSGPVVLLGCAHAGIVEILDDLKVKSGNETFHAVIGGTHLGSAPDEYIDRTVEMLKKYKLSVVGTSHCTGFNGAARLASEFGDKVRTASVGDVFEF